MNAGSPNGHTPRAGRAGGPCARWRARRLTRWLWSEVGDDVSEDVVDGSGVGGVVSLGSGFGGDAFEHGPTALVVLVSAAAVGDGKDPDRTFGGTDLRDQIGRASCRERV